MLTPLWLSEDIARQVVDSCAEVLRYQFTVIYDFFHDALRLDIAKLGR
jgi:hypothetical protein